MKNLKKTSYQSLFVISALLFVALTSCNNTETQNKSIKELDNKFPIVLQVKGMYCSLCSDNVERYVSKLAAVDSVFASASEKRVRIRLKEKMSLTKEKLSETVSDAGYEVERFIKYPESIIKE